MARSKLHQKAKSRGAFEMNEDYQFTFQAEYLRLISHYQNIALNRYRWENLPNGLESRHIEEALYSKGEAVFFDDEALGLMCLKASSMGQNVYGDPTHVIATGFGYYRTYKTEEVVRILNNDTKTPTAHMIHYYCNRLATVDDLIQQNLRQQRHPYIISTTKANEFSMKAIFKKIFKGEDAIFVDKTLTEEMRQGLQAIRTDSPYLIDKLVMYKHQLEKELNQLLGLNSTIEKKERLLVDETNANNSEIEMNLDLGFKQRELACKLINEKFGLNVKVYRTMEIIDPIYMTHHNDVEQMEVNDDEPLHD